MIRKTKSVVKFLNRHAEASAALGQQIDSTFDHAVVIPSYGEGELLDAALASIPCLDGESVLAVVNINAKKGSPVGIQHMNSATAARLQARYPQVRRLDDTTSMHQTPFGGLVLLRCVLPNSQGVGLARKVGADFVLGAWSEDKLRSNWIYCTDADVRLPPDYFAPPAKEGAAMLLNFRHFPHVPELERSAKIYDAWLRSYVLGLTQAGSPYAFHTIGSTVAVDAATYAAVRGFPKRVAAEDFYLLNKLSKQGSLVRSPATPISLAARLSDRVPFGTGRAMRDAHNGGEDALPFFYDPVLYSYLAVVLEAAEACIAQSNGFEDALRSGCEERGLASGPLLVACQLMEIDTALDNAVNSALSERRRRKSFHGWFDAFRTMKFIHTMRDGGIESDPWDIAVQHLDELLRLQDEWTADDRQVLRSTLASIADTT